MLRLKKWFVVVFIFSIGFELSAQDIAESGSWCEGTFALELTDDLATNIQWSKNGKILKNENNLNIVIGQYGIGEYTVSYSLNGRSLAKSKMIETGPLDVNFTYVEYLAAGGIQFYGESIDEDKIVSWEWDIGLGTIKSGQNPMIIFPKEDTYTITLNVTDTDGCVGAYTQIIVWSYEY